MAGHPPYWARDPDWLGKVVEEIVEPDRPIIDTHVHLSAREERGRYLLEDLWADTGSGHRVEKVVYIECGEAYRRDGPERLRCVGEMEFAVECAARCVEGGLGRGVIAGIVAHADLTLGDAVEEVLQALDEAGQGLFCGIRHGGAHDTHPEDLVHRGGAPEGLYARDDYRRGLRVLGRQGLPHDSWHFHHQMRAFTELARAVPDTTMILDHFGTPLGVGVYANKRKEILEHWRCDISELATCPNVVVKLGGLALVDTGFGWDRRPMPPTSVEFVDAQKGYYLHAIEAFGPDRCMFESNFPVDKRSVSYHVLWNAFKSMVADLAEGEKHALFYGTAARVYRI